MCINPIKAKLTYSEYDRKTHVRILRPGEFYGEYDNPLSLPCGKCIGCLDDRRKNWIRRMMLEMDCHTCGTFLTLTYADKHLPEHPSKSHVQKFLKRLRNISRDYGVPFPKDFRYFAVAERGSLFGRSHYHLALFGLDMLAPDFAPRFVMIKDGYPVYCSGLCEKLWKYGFNTVKPLSPENIRYLAKYITKQNEDDTFTLKSLSLGSRFIYNIKRSGRSLHFTLKPDSARLLMSGSVHLPTSRGSQCVPIPRNIYQKLYDVDPFLAADCAFMRSLNVPHYKDFNDFVARRESYIASLNEKTKKQTLKGKINNEKTRHIHPRQ